MWRTERRIERCRDRGSVPVRRAKKAAAERRAVRAGAAADTRQADAFRQMMGAPGERGEPSLAQGLADVDVHFGRSRRRRSAGQRAAARKRGAPRGDGRDVSDDSGGDGGRF